METITIETQPTADRNIALLKARLGNFDLMGPLRGPCLYVEMFNTAGGLFDGVYVKIDGDDWQNWPCNLTGDEDYEYLSSVILRKLGLGKRLKAPYFTQYPQSINVIQGQNFTISCEVDGYPEEFTYQWSKESTVLPFTGNSCEIINVQTTNTGIYNVLVSNSQGSISGSSYIGIIPLAAPSIITQPVNTTLNSGALGQIYVTANGVPSPAYQWNKDGVAVSGAIGSSLFIANMQPENTGFYNVTISNSQGSITSDTVGLSIRTFVSEDNSI